MKAMRLDFSGRSRLRNPPLSSRTDQMWAAAVAVSFLLLLAGVLTMSLRETAAEEARSELRRVEVLSGEGEGETVDAELSSDEKAGVNTAVRMLNFPWSATFDALERSGQPNVMIQSLELGPARQGTKIIFDSPDVPTALGYMDALRQQPNMGSVALLRQEVVSNSEGAQHLRFTVEARPGSSDGPSFGGEQ